MRNISKYLSCLKDDTMKRTLSFLSFLLLAGSLAGFAQENITVADSTETAVFEKVEIEADFPGGTQAWRKYLERNLNPNVPINNGAPAGKFTVWVQFIVGKDGLIANIKALTNLGFGMEEEVIRIIRKSGKWSPAIQHGRMVKAYRKQPVVFLVMDDNFEITTKTPYVLYTNTDNELIVDAGKVKMDDLRLTTSEGTIVAANGKFIVRVTKPGRVTIELYDNKKKKRIGAASFEVMSEK
jgi:hypothetical protein